MVKIRFLFFLVFVGLLTLSSMQFFFLEKSDLDKVCLVEEQQETIGDLGEDLSGVYQPTDFFLFLAMYSDKEISLNHMNYQQTAYPFVDLSVPYSPPEWV